MTKLDGKSLDIKEKNIEKLKEIFPEIVSDGMIDFDKLKQLLGEYVDDSEERYRFTWNGKGEALRLSQTPSMGTLRPVKEDSKDWDNTENLFIEGDNLEVLKLLQKSYFGKIKMIYIDPPYNTGNDIIYKNNFHNSLAYYKAFTRQADSDGFKFSTNREYSGRYHTDWLNMMYPRLRLAKNLLTEDGIIVISIDDYEFYNLKKICDEIFGEYNFVGTVVTRCNPQGRGKDNIDPVHEYNYIYAKNLDNLEKLKIKRENKDNRYHYLLRSGTNSRKHERPYRFYPMLLKDNKISCIEEDEYKKIYDGTNFNEEHLRYLREKYTKLGYEVIFPIAQNGEEKVWQRQYSRVVKECHTYIYDNGQIKTPIPQYRTPQSLWLDERYSNSGSGTNVLIDLFEGLKPFDFPKSYKTVQDFISLIDSQNKGFIVLDFFAGSGTTAHSVIDLNAKDGGNRKYIMVQLPESLQDNYNKADKDRKKELTKIIEFLKANNKKLSLTEIGKERIRRAGDKIKKELEEKYNNASEEERKNIKNPKDLDIGFKVFRLDSSNIKKWNPGKYGDIQIALEDSLNPYVEGRTEEDVVYEMMLKMGIDLTYPIEEYMIDGKTIYSIGFGSLMICLSKNIDIAIAKKMVELKEENQPKIWRAIFRDASFNSDQDKTNVKETLKAAGLLDESFITL